MGIEGLQTLVSNLKNCTVTERLSKGSTLVVDGDGFAFVALFETKAVKMQRHLGGTYDKLHQVVVKKVSALQRAGLKLVFYFDGHADNKFKQMEWDSRDNQREKQWLKLCYGIIYGDECPKSPQLGPLMLFDQVRATLASMGVEITFCEGEADPIIAKRVRDENSMLAGPDAPRWYVYGQDSDYCAMKDCPYIRFEALTIGGGARAVAPRAVAPRAVAGPPAVLCNHFFLRGSCMFGGECRFAHQDTVLTPNTARRQLCAAYAKGGCNVRQCRKLHLCEADVLRRTNERKSSQARAVPATALAATAQPAPTVHAEVLYRANICRALGMTEEAFVNWCVINGNDCTWYCQADLFTVREVDSGRLVPNDRKTDLNTYRSPHASVHVSSSDPFIQEAIEYYDRFYNTGDVTSADTEPSEPVLESYEWEDQSLSLRPDEKDAIAQFAARWIGDKSRPALVDSLLDWMATAAPSPFEGTLTEVHIEQLRAMCAQLGRGTAAQKIASTGQPKLAWKDFLAAAKYQNVWKRVLGEISASPVIPTSVKVKLLADHAPMRLFNGILFQSLMASVYQRSKQQPTANEAAQAQTEAEAAAEPPSSELLDPTRLLSAATAFDIDGLSSALDELTLSSQLSSPDTDVDVGSALVRYLDYFALDRADSITAHGTDFPRVVLLSMALRLQSRLRKQGSGQQCSPDSVAMAQSQIAANLVRCYAAPGHVVVVYLPGIVHDYAHFVQQFETLRLRYTVTKQCFGSGHDGASEAEEAPSFRYDAGKINIVVTNKRLSAETLAAVLPSESPPIMVIDFGARARRDSLPMPVIPATAAAAAGAAFGSPAATKANASKRAWAAASSKSSLPLTTLAAGNVDADVDGEGDADTSVVSSSGLPDGSDDETDGSQREGPAETEDLRTWRRALMWIDRETADLRVPAGAHLVWRLYSHSSLQ